MIISFLEAANGAKRRAMPRDGKTVGLFIPPAIDDGQTVSVKHLGDPEFRGATPGDVLFEIRVEPHAFFTSTNNNMHVELPVTLREVVLGSRVRVPAIAGPATKAIPRHSNTGDELCLRGKGTPGDKSGASGDQYVTLKIVLPDKLNERLRRLTSEWVPETDHDVRRHFGLA